MIEKERKFKVKSKKFISFSHKVINIKQGYLSKGNNLAIRIRISDKNAYLCIKGPTSKNGISRFEFEKKINLIEGSKLLKFCLPRIILKKRYLIEYKNLDIGEATKISLEKVKKLGGSGGVIALDKFGNYAMEFNTKGMYRGIRDSKGNFQVSIFKND